MTTTNEPRDVDAIVVGSGQGGVPLAAALANEGKHVVLFERGRFGGTCVNAGCTPSKAFLAAAHGVGRARRARAIGLRGDVTLDFGVAMERTRSFIDEGSTVVRKRLADAGVEIVAAEAAFVGERTVAGGGTTVRAPFVCLDTGAAATIPPITGLAESGYLDNVSFFAQTTLPERLIVLGGGYIGLELGQGMARAGSRVTIVDSHDRILSNEEDDASAVLAQSLLDDGVTLRLGARATRFERDGAAIRVTFADETTLEGDALLVAVGRTPSTAALHVERSGIALDDRGFVAVDAYLQTTCPGVYALGDVARQPAFTHVAWEDHRRILSTLHGTPRTRDDRVLAYTTFTEPQVARAGLSLAQARAAGYAASTRTLPLGDVARAWEWNEERGFFRIVVDDATDRILGATFVGYECGELIHIAIAWLDGKQTRADVAQTMYVHPTFAEGLPTLARLPHH